jgi:hypothetical protein
MTNPEYVLAPLRNIEIKGTGLAPLTSAVADTSVSGDVIAARKMHNYTMHAY